MKGVFHYMQGLKISATEYVQRRVIRYNERGFLDLVAMALLSNCPSPPRPPPETETLNLESFMERGTSGRPSFRRVMGGFGENMGRERGGMGWDEILELFGKNRPANIIRLRAFWYSMKCP